MRRSWIVLLGCLALVVACLVAAFAGSERRAPLMMATLPNGDQVTYGRSQFPGVQFRYPFWLGYRFAHHYYFVAWKHRSVERRYLVFVMDDWYFDYAEIHGDVTGAHVWIVQGAHSPTSVIATLELKTGAFQNANCIPSDPNLNLTDQESGDLSQQRPYPAWARPDAGVVLARSMGEAD